MMTNRTPATPVRTMRAAVLDAPGPADTIAIRDLPIPTPEPGWVLIRVEAFGINRSELQTRLGLAYNVTFPRVLGIEAVGVVETAPGGEFEPGRKVVAMMGGMGRQFDGGYAEYTCVPASQIIPIDTELDWTLVGAIPEMLQTSYGALTVGLDAQAGGAILIRGGTSSIGLCVALLAKRLGMTVFSTTRNPARAGTLTAAGVDHVIIEDGSVAKRVRDILPGGVDAVLELVGAPTIPDSLQAARVHGVVCVVGSLSNEWLLPDFDPGMTIPNVVFLTSYGGDAGDLPREVLQDFLDSVAAGDITVPIDRVYSLDDIAQAHADMEAGRATGKLVVRLG